MGSGASVLEGGFWLSLTHVMLRRDRKMVGINREAYGAESAALVRPRHRA
jgi:hypothetical protein